MEIKTILKRIPCLLRIWRLLLRRPRSSIPGADCARLSNDELLSLMRHESHRIEKAVYNNIFKRKLSVYREKRERLGTIYQILEERGYSIDEPTIVWSRQIYDAFDTLESDFVQPNRLAASIFRPTAAKQFIEFVQARRSVRVWGDEQPDQNLLEKVALQMIDAARWAPNSGNRQAWRFLILNRTEEKELLKSIKEKHCVSAPLLIFVGMDTRLYGAFGKSERSIFIDAGAAIMQMVLLAHKCGLGVCWNHFADDLINLRGENKKIYCNFVKNLKIPAYIAPIAIIAIGLPKFIPPTPARMEIERLMIDPHD